MRNGAEREPGANVKIKEGRKKKKEEVKSSQVQCTRYPEVPRRLGGASPSDALLRYSYNVQGGHPNHWHYH